VSAIASGNRSGNPGSDSPGADQISPLGFGSRTSPRGRRIFFVGRGKEDCRWCNRGGQFPAV